jgi:ATP-dependent DNA helicase RecG
MKTRLLALDDVLALSTRPESHFFDRKSYEVTPRQIEKIAVAFSNADGGDFVIGISDDSDEPDPTKRWHGASTIEEMNKFLQSLFSLTPSLDIRYESLSHPDRSGYCLRVQVEKSASVCKTSDGTVYVRQGAQSLPLEDPDRTAKWVFNPGFDNKRFSLRFSLTPIERRFWLMAHCRGERGTPTGVRVPG